MLITKTADFDRSLNNISDAKAVAKIAIRIDRLSLGNPGDVKAIGEGISEMRIDYGPGYRVYYTHVGKKIVLLLTCGTKGTQTSDIAAAKKLKGEYK